ncbi:MAG: metal-dependent hydrolase, partial [Lentisphaeria bacterium]|nr:metal-dependent hydrolase [Lentisphaeria bacterium]
MTRKLFPVLLCAVLAAAVAGCLNSGSGSEPVKLATYNIQIGRGMDRRYNIERTVEALFRIEAETIVLNEVDVGTKRSFGVDQPSYLGGKLKMNSVFGRASDRPGG